VVLDPEVESFGKVRDREVGVPDVHPLLANVLTKLGSALDVVVLAGFPGPVPTDDSSTRLYLSLDLSEYVDLADTDILYTEHPSADQPLAPSVLWVKSEAALQHSAGSTDLTAADYLKGEIVETQLKFSSGATVNVDAGFSWYWFCTCSRTTPITGLFSPLRTTLNPPPPPP